MFNTRLLSQINLSLKGQSLLAFLLSLIAGLLGWKLYGNPASAIAGDSTYYYNTALFIKENLSSLFTSTNIGITESLNAIAIGILIKLPFNDIYEVFVFQILLFGATGLFLFKFVNEYLDLRSSWIVFLFYVVNNKNWQWIFVFKPGVWVLFWMSLILLYGYRLYKDPENKRLLITYSLLVGALILTDMRYIPHMAAFTFFILIQLKPIGIYIKKMFLVFSIVLLSITPWLVREFFVFDRFIFISDVNTILIQQTFAPEKFKESWVNKGEERIRDSLWLPDRRNLQHEELIKEDKLTREQVQNMVVNEEEKSKFRQRIEYGFKLWQPFKFKYSYEPLHTFKFIEAPASKLNNLNRILTFGILYPFLTFGLFVIIRNKDSFGWGLFAVLLSHFLLHAFTYVDWRYLLPVLPIITLIAIMGLNHLIRYLKEVKILV